MANDVAVRTRARVRRTRSPRRRVVALVVVAAVLAIAGWLVVRGLAARAHLSRAQRGIAQLKSQLVAGDTTAAAAEVNAIAAETAQARRLTSDPVWRAAAAIPYAGNSLAAVAGVAGSADDLVRKAFPDLLRAAQLLGPGRIQIGGAQVALGPLQRAAPSLAVASQVTAAALTRLQRLPHAWLVPPVASAVGSFTSDVRHLADTANAASVTAHVLPPMLGAEGRRHYFVAFQTNAELRGTGGLVGAYAIVTVDHGVLHVDHIGKDSELRNISPPLSDLPADFVSRYKRFDSGAEWSQSNMSPDFPTVSKIWLGLWQRNRHERLDGAIALDPVALRYVLEATGPVVLPGGGVVSSHDVVALTEQTTYGLENRARKDYLQLIAHATLAKLTAVPHGSSRALLSALVNAVSERHLMVASAHASEEAALETTTVGAALPRNSAPYLQVAFNNAAGNKLDYYIRAKLTYVAGGCSGATRNSTAALVISNTAPRSGLPAIVTQRLDHPPAGYPVGQQHLYVSFFTTPGAQLTSVTQDGRPVTMEVESEAGHPVYSRFLDVDPGSSVTLRVHLEEPTAPGTARVPAPILVAEQTPQVFAPICR